MENFDGVGRMRTEEIAIGTQNDGMGINWVDIDASGALWDPEVETFTDHLEMIPVDGARELSLALAQTQSVQSCLVEKAFRMAINRPINLAGRDMWNTAADRSLTNVEEPSFACAKEQLENVLATSNQSPKALFEAITNLDLIRFRR